MAQDVRGGERVPPRTSDVTFSFALSFTRLVTDPLSRSDLQKKISTWVETSPSVAKIGACGVWAAEVRTFFRAEENKEETAEITTRIARKETHYKTSLHRDGNPAKVTEHIRDAKRVTIGAQIAMHTQTMSTRMPWQLHKTGGRENATPSGLGCTGGMLHAGNQKRSPIPL